MAFTRRIDVVRWAGESVSSDVRASGTRRRIGWQMTELSSYRLVIVNVALVEDSASVQYVANPAN